MNYNIFKFTIFLKINQKFEKNWKIYKILNIRQGTLLDKFIYLGLIIIDIALGLEIIIIIIKKSK